MAQIKITKVKPIHAEHIIPTQVHGVYILHRISANGEVQTDFFIPYSPYVKALSVKGA